MLIKSTSPQFRWTKLSTTPYLDERTLIFRVTHPFHPLYGQEFELVDCRCAWGEDRVYFYDKKGRLTKLPAAWTDVAPTDPFVVVAAGRSPFRFQDLLGLAELIEPFEDGRVAVISRSRRLSRGPLNKRHSSPTGSWTFINGSNGPINKRTEWTHWHFE